MNKIILLFFLMMTIVCTKLAAQEQLIHRMGSHVDSLNQYYQQASLPLYIYVATSPSEKPTQLAPNEDKILEPIYLDGHGKHYVKHEDVLHNVSDKFAVYADGIAPISISSFKNALTYNTGSVVYYGKNLTVSLATKDEMSGIKALYHSINKAPYQPYQTDVRFDKEGEVSYKYYAVDNVGNAEDVKVRNFTIDLSPPQTYHNIVGIAQGNIISSSTKIYLTKEDERSGVAKTFYKIDDEIERPYTDIVPFSYLPDGDHTLTYYSIDQVGNQEEAKVFEFYLDKSSPIMSADVLGDKFIVGDQVYFSGRTKLKLTSVDNKSGIKEVKYSIDGQPYLLYDDPFYLPSKSGLHTIKYYAVDNMGNRGGGSEGTDIQQYVHNVGLVYVDLTGPMLSNQFIGPKFLKGDTLYISSQTQINLSAKDPESGLNKITYSIDQSQSELLFGEAFSISQKGLHKVSYFGYDNVNNRNARDTTFIIDNEGPEILVTFSVGQIESSKEDPLYPAYVDIFLAATDEQTGYGEIKYSINGGKEQKYEGVIKGLSKNKRYTIKITAYDKLRNETVKEIKFRTARY